MEYSYFGGFKKLIAQVNVKMCPFCKRITMANYNYGVGESLVNTVYDEEFLECIEKSCMLYSEMERKCLLGRKEEG